MSFVTSIFIERLVVVCLHQSQVSPFDLKYETCFQEQKQLNPIVPEQATHPISVPVSKEIISDSVEL